MPADSLLQIRMDSSALGKLVTSPLGILTSILGKFGELSLLNLYSEV